MEKELNRIWEALAKINGELGTVFRRLGRVERLTLTVLVMVVVALLMLALLVVLNLQAGGF